MHRIETTIAGIGIPDSALAREATEFMREASTRLLFDHSRRVFLWASLQAERLSLDYEAELLYVGAMFHDVGLLEGHRSEHERFEIDGANAARAFLERHGLPEERVMTVWESIALHTTRQVPNYMQSEVRLVALGVQYDVLGSAFDTLTAEQRDAVLAAHPRTKIQDGHDRGPRGRRPRQAGNRRRKYADRHSRSDGARLRATQRLRRHQKLSLRDLTRRKPERFFRWVGSRSRAAGGIPRPRLVEATDTERRRVGDHRAARARARHPPGGLMNGSIR